MKFLGSQLPHYLGDKQFRRNTAALLKYLAFLAAIVTLFAVLFHVIMLREGQKHSIVTGFYWTLTVMTTLGFGDITFEGDLGRAFSIVVLISGVVFLLIVLPFLFIRHFYGPWIEARLRWMTPRRVPEGTSGHVVVCGHDAVTEGLVRRLELHGIPYFVLEPDPASAGRLEADGVSVVVGELDDRRAYEATAADRARLVVANRTDQANTNITLTVREVSASVPICALVEHPDSLDILELSGATQVIPLKQRLGEQLATRVSAGRARTDVIGNYEGLLIAEFRVDGTPLVDRTLRDAGLRDRTGVSVIGVWNRGRLAPAQPTTVLTEKSVAVAVGSAEQLERLDALLSLGESTEPGPVLVIGGGVVGQAAARALGERGIPVHLVERDEALASRLGGMPFRLLVGDAADGELLKRAGLLAARTVVLTTNDDAMNIYLAVYCRRLHPSLRIVSRITHEKNLEAIHRAGADLVLGHASLGASLILSPLLGRAAVVLGEGLDLHAVPVPRTLVGRTLRESRIGELTGLTVIALRHGDAITSSPPGDVPLPAGGELVLVGTQAQLTEFHAAMGRRARAAT